VGCAQSPVRLIRNGWDQGNWLKVKLISPVGQAGAFGAKVWAYPAGAEESDLLGMREAKSSTGYFSQDDPVLHFGLGEHFLVELKVKFATGETVTLRNLFAKQTVLVDGAGRQATGVTQEDEPEPGEPAPDGVK